MRKQLPVRRRVYRIQQLLLIVGIITGMAQSGRAGAENPHTTIRKATSAIVIDGVVDERAWRDALMMEIPYETYPGDNAPAKVRTECFLTYDENKFYVAFRAYDADPDAIRAYISSRDSLGTHDFVGFLLDTFNDGSRAYLFFVNPLGIQYDATRDDLGQGEDSSWDAIWDAAGRLTATGYEVEMAVPFNQIRFPAGGDTLTMGFNGVRMYPRDLRRENTTQTFDRNINGYVRQFTKITGFEEIQPGRNLQLTPTLTAVRSDERANFPHGDLKERDSNTDAGLTASWGITSSLTANAAFNPDFSQVEADVAQLDVNTQFALFYDETRPFFLEGANIFTTPLQAVYTRTIAAPDVGLKLTSKEGGHLLGVIYAHDSQTNILLPGSQNSDTALLECESDVTIARYRYDLPGNSTIGLIASDRRADGGYHNSLAGFDGTWRFTDADKISYQFLGTQTRYPDTFAIEHGQQRGSFNGAAGYLKYVHDTRNWSWQVNYQGSDNGFRADAGFIPEVGNQYTNATLAYTFWREKDSAFSYLYLSGGGERSADGDGHELLKYANFYSEIGLPYQTFVSGSLNIGSRYFGGQQFDQINGFININSRPSGAVSLGFQATLGDLVDFENVRDGSRIRLSPTLTLRLGRQWEFGFRHDLEHFSVEQGRLYLANLSRIRIVYNINPRMFVRLITQYSDIRRDANLYSFPVESTSRKLFNQVLFSYELNPQTVLYIGYSDNSIGNMFVDLTRADRTFFVKLGYAWIL